MSTAATGRTRETDERREVLLVEDNPGDVRLLREAFGETDVETRLQVVHGVDAAVDVLRGDRGDAPMPELVLLDLNLPGRDGEALLGDVRNDPELRGLPILVLTGSKSREDVDRCYRAQANAYLTKPRDLDGFVEMADLIDRFWFARAELPEL